MNTLEVALLILCGLLAGGLLGALSEVRRLHRTSMAAWMAQGSAQDEARRLRHELAETQRQLGALQATRGEVLEAAIGAAKLAQLDALRASNGREHS